MVCLTLLATAGEEPSWNDRRASVAHRAIPLPSVAALRRLPMVAQKAKGRLRGKQPKLKPAQEAHLVKLHGAGEHSTAELAELFGVARSTVYRAVQRAEGVRAVAAIGASATRAMTSKRG